MKQKIRAFVAVDVNEAVRNEAEQVIRQLSSAPGDVKWVEPENLHVTLKFLHEVPSVEIRDVHRAIAEAIADLPAFDYEVSGVGAFPHVDRPRAIWLGAAAGEQSMVELAARIETALDALGYRPEARRFKAHLTIGRARRGGRPLAVLSDQIRELADLPVGRTRVREVVLYSSELDRRGPIYTALGRAQLRST